MAHLHRSVAALRISGDDLLPEEVSKLLGATPTLARTKGEEIVYASGRTRIAKIGQWHIEATDAEPENLDAQVKEILSQLTGDLAVWSVLSKRFDIDLFCGWFMQSGNEGLTISPATLLALGERGIELSVDIYAPTCDDA